MWNRVFLLASGFAFGWTLVSYLTAPLAQVRDRLVQLALSLAVGLVVIGLMGFSSARSGLAGGFVFALSALVAYAGNARQTSRVEEPSPLEQAPIQPPPHVHLGPSSDRPEHPQEVRIAIVLVSEGEPVEYDGPKPWARRFQELAASGEPVPHWFVRPFTYARIRSAYRAMGGRNPLNASLNSLAKQLERQLGAGCVVRAAYLRAAPALADSLVHLAEEGYMHIVLVPIGFERDPKEALRVEVIRSRVREAGVQVTYAAPLETAVWAPGPRTERLRQLAQGIAVPPPPEPGPEVVEHLSEGLLAATVRRIREEDLHVK